MGRVERDVPVQPHLRDATGKIGKKSLERSLRQITLGDTRNEERIRLRGG